MKLRTDITLDGYTAPVECANFGGVAQAMKDFGKTKVHIQHIYAGKVIYESNHTLREVEKLEQVVDHLSPKEYLEKLKAEDHSRDDDWEL